MRQVLKWLWPGSLGVMTSCDGAARHQQACADGLLTAIGCSDLQWIGRQGSVMLLWQVPGQSRSSREAA